MSTTDDGLELAPSVVRRLACDADIIPVALGGKGEVLDVGRLHRLVTPPLWRAVVCRDQHCAFPGCTRPPVMCHAHHIIHWADGGETKLENLVLLRLSHESRVSRMDSSGREILGCGRERALWRCRSVDVDASLGEGLAA